MLGISDIKAAKLAQLEPYQDYLHGNRLASILAIKGEQGQAEMAGSAPFFGADGVALEKAFEALGWGNNSWCGVLLEPLAQPVLSSEQLRLLVEIIDPQVVVALDGLAAGATQECFGAELLPDKAVAGKKIDVLGRLFLSLDGFEASLQDPQSKQKSWSQLKALKK